MLQALARKPFDDRRRERLPAAAIGAIIGGSEREAMKCLTI
jgi:hypothetical protein